MAKSRRSKGKDGSSILVIIAVLALLAMIGVAIYKLSGQHGNGEGNKTCASFQGCQSGTLKSSTTKCKTQKCTANECCTPPTCKNYTCKSGTLKSPPGSCNLSGCTDTVCCDKTKRCDETITCSKNDTAVDKNIECNGACSAAQCCTREAWVEQQIEDFVSGLGEKFENCTAGVKAVVNALKKKCGKEPGPVSVSFCLLKNADAAINAAKDKC
jgi:hypothetical protein